MRTLEQVVEAIAPRSECCTQTIKEALETGKLVIPFTGAELEKLIKAEEAKSFRYCVPLMELIKAIQAAQKEIR